MTILQLYDYIYSDKFSEIDNATYIEIYENNKDVVETGNEDDFFYEIARITSDYALVLSYKEHYSKALPYLNKAIQLWERYKNEWEKDLLEGDYYRNLRFYRAMANYYLRDYTESKNEFRWLVKTYPDNTKYKNWLEGVQKRKLDYLYWTLLILSFACYIPTKLVNHAVIDDLGRTLFTIFFISAVLIMIYQYLSFKKK